MSVAHIIYNRIILITAGFISIGLVQAQDLQFNQLTTRNGLPAMECYNILQDKQGYVWVFTEYGIAKHNGQRFVSVCTNIPVKEQNAYAIFQTKQGEIYFANSSAKIYRVRNDSAFSIRAIEEFTHNFNQPKDVLYQLLVDNNGDVYFSSYEAAFKYNNKLNRVERLVAGNQGTKVEIEYQKVQQSFLAVRNYPQVMINNINIRILDSVVVNQFIKTDSVSFYKGSELLAGRSGYYFSTNHFVFRVSKEKVIRSSECGDVIRLRPGPNHEIWALTNNGIIVLREDLSVKTRYLLDKIISDVVIDNAGGVWVTTIGHGIYHCRDIKELLYCYPGIYNKEVLMVKSDSTHLFMSLSDGGCYEISNENTKKIHQFDRVVFCTGIYYQNNSYLFATKKGIYFKEKNAGKLQEIKNAKGLSIYSVGLVFPSTDTCISFCGTGLVILINKKYKYEIDVKHKIYSYSALNHHNYLLGTKKGLFVYNLKTNEIKPYHSFFSNMFITYMATDPQKNTWIVTRGEGVYIINREQKIKKVVNFPFTAIDEIIFTSNNSLLVSTNTGVYSCHFKINQMVGEWLSVTDFQVNDIDINENHVWLASAEGLYTSDFERSRSYHFFPVITNSVYSGGKRINTSNQIYIPSGKDIRFNFDFLNYRWPVKNFYFTLAGPSPLTGNISGGALQIQHLSPGSYTLRVYPMQGSLYYKEHYTQTSFIITPAIWQTVWFKTATIVGIIFFTACIVGFYFNQRRKREQKKGLMIKTLAEYRLTALKAQINPHFISNSLSAIQSIIEHGKIDQANQYIAKFSLFIRYVLKYTDRNVIRLNDELTILDLNIELERLRFSDYFLFHIEIDPGVETNEIYIPPMITQPFVENAIWHGLLSLKGERTPELLVHVGYKNENLVIGIQDNGVGRKKTLDNVSIGNLNLKESRGISLIKHRIDHLNELYDMNTTRMEITDLYDAHGNATGTRVDIILPKELLYYLEKRTYESVTR